MKKEIQLKLLKEISSIIEHEVAQTKNGLMESKLALNHWAHIQNFIQQDLSDRDPNGQPYSAEEKKHMLMECEIKE